MKSILKKKMIDSAKIIANLTPNELAESIKNKAQLKVTKRLTTGVDLRLSQGKYIK